MLSFIIPAHNEEAELPATLLALRKAADAAGHAYEIIVAVDASTDATAAITRSFGARVIDVNLRQIAAVRNAGARIARGDVFFFVDADTRISASHITGALRELADGCAGGSARVALDGEVPLWARNFLRVFSLVYFAANLGVGAFMFMPRANFEKVGGFDEQYFAGEEVYLTKSLKTLGRFRILPEPIVTSARKVRMHSGRQMLGHIFGMMLGGPRTVRTRARLGLWYDGKRESKVA